MAIRHSTPADNSFTPEGKRAWDADHEGDASDIEFLPSGTGAIAGDVQTELRANGIRPEHFGAVGDGTTDDSAAFALAITAAKTSHRKIYLRSALYKANFTITGENVHIEADSFNYEDGGTVGIIAATLTDPVIQIGDGTTQTNDISLNGISLNGQNTADKGLRIYGANDVYLNRFSSRAFEQYQVQLDSSATNNTFYIFVDGFHIATGTTSGSLGLDYNFGAGFTTAVYFSNGAFNAASGGSYNIDLNGSGARVNLANVWLECRNNQGINFGTGTIAICANVVLDSGSAADVLITLPSNTAIAAFIYGTVNIDGLASMPGGNTAALTSRSLLPFEAIYNFPHVQGSLSFQDSGGNAWDQYVAGNQNQRISRSSTNLNITSSDGNVQLLPNSTTGAANVVGRDIALVFSSGQRITSTHASTSVNTTSGATVTATNLIPANSLVLGVTIRVTTLVTGATSMEVGDGTDADRWGTTIAVALNTTTNISNFTIASPVYYGAATSVVLTANGPNFSAGAVRITVHYISLTPATS